MVRTFLLESVISSHDQLWGLRDNSNLAVNWGKVNGPLFHSVNFYLKCINFSFNFLLDKLFNSKLCKLLPKSSFMKLLLKCAAELDKNRIYES